MSGRGTYRGTGQKDARSFIILPGDPSWPANFDAGTRSAAFRVSGKGTIVLEADMLVTGLTATDLDFAFEFSNDSDKNPNLAPPDHTYGPKSVIQGTTAAAPYEALAGRLEVITVPVADYNQPPWVRTDPASGQNRFRILLPAFLCPELHWARVYPRARGGDAQGIIRAMGGLNL